jgi:SRSO17 transposase
MTEAVTADWERAFAAWLAPFLAALGHKVRRRWAPVYVRGLLGPGERKSVQPMAARVAPQDNDQLHHFISSPAWATAPLEAVLAREVERLVGGPEAVLIIDDTALPKKGVHSVGVARQYCGALGKTANCQSLVSLTLARDEVPVPIALRLYLPKEWTQDRARCRKAGVPTPCRTFRSKGAIALAELDRLRAAGVHFGCAVADAGYGAGATFRRGLAKRVALWAVGIPKAQKVYSAAVTVTWPPPAPTGRRRRHGIPSELPITAEAALAAARWRQIRWRRGTKGPLTARFAARRVRVADGPQAQNGRRLPGEAELWLVGERRPGGETKYYLTSHPAETPLKTLAATIKARWACEQAHQQMKEELGLDHFEGRSWAGLHHHALLTMIAFAFLQHLRLAQSRTRGETITRPATAAEPARHPPRAAGSARRQHPPALSKMPAAHHPAQTRMKLPK